MYSIWKKLLQHQEGIKLVAAVIGIIVPLSMFGMRCNEYFYKPALSYENSIFSTGSEAYIVSIVVRNEGRASAEDVQVNVDVNGIVRNTWTKKGFISGEIDESEMFQGHARIDNNTSSSQIDIPYIAKGMKYAIGILVEPTELDVDSKVLVSSSNGGIAAEYVEEVTSNLTSLSVGIALGIVIALAMRYFILRTIRRIKSHTMFQETTSSDDAAT
jgi:hypothetical protein